MHNNQSISVTAEHGSTAKINEVVRGDAALRDGTAVEMLTTSPTKTVDTGIKGNKAKVHAQGQSVETGVEVNTADGHARGNVKLSEISGGEAVEQAIARKLEIKRLGSHASTEDTAMQQNSSEVAAARQLIQGKTRKNGMREERDNGKEHQSGRGWRKREKTAGVGGEQTRLASKGYNSVEKEKG
eukprot:100201-Rhodomonas_salina.2